MKAPEQFYATRVIMKNGVPAGDPRIWPPGELCVLASDCDLGAKQECDNLRAQLAERTRQVRVLEATLRTAKGWMDNASNPQRNHTKETIVGMCQSVGGLLRDTLSALPIPTETSAEQRTAELVALPDSYCIMPRSLTAENGAKALLLGEFKVTSTHECPECAELDDPNEHCGICDGEGQYSQGHTISWDQIKFIYSKAVGGLSLSPGRAELKAARIAELDRLRGEALTFTYKHPTTTERRSVSLSRAEVAEGMESNLYEKLVAQLCQCEPVGETNVVDCNCHEYGHDFERVADTDTEGSAV